MIDSQHIVRIVETGGDGLRIMDYTTSGFNPLQKDPIEYRGNFVRLDEWFERIKVNNGQVADVIIFATAGVIEKNAVVVDWPNGHWLDGTDLQQECAERLDAKAFVFNDMEAAATGMAWLTGWTDFVGITLSSGWGARVFLDGEMVDDNTELGGHLLYDSRAEAKMCSCGKRGHFEGVFAGKAMREEIHRLANRANMPVPDGIEPGLYLDQCFDQEIPWAMDIYNWWARGVGLWLANVLTAFPITGMIYKGSQGLNMLPQVDGKIRDHAREAIIGGLESRVDALEIIPSPGFKNEDAFTGALHLWLERKALMEAHEV